MKNYNILLVQLFSNGDCLYVIPIAEQIKRDFPNSHLTWAVAPFSKSLLLNNPNVDQFLEVTEVVKADVFTYRKFINKIRKEEEKGLWDKVIVTQNMDYNTSYYDGIIRSMYLNSYFKKIEVDIQPKVYLTSDENENILKFVEDMKLQDFTNVILFEFAPQSGQLSITMDDAYKLSELIVSNTNNVVIMSSPYKLDFPRNNIIDGSKLNLRETAALMKHCTLVLGCSSGISWLATTNIGNNIPLIQVIDPSAVWINPMSRDFQRYNIEQPLIELYDFNVDSISRCVKEALVDFNDAAKKYSKPLKVNFKTTRLIVYNFVCFFQYNAILNHIKINVRYYGFEPGFFYELLIGIITSPITLIKNFIRKRFS